MQNDYVKLRHTKDIVGTEICGAIKNVIAIASGMLSDPEMNWKLKELEDKAIVSFYSYIFLCFLTLLPGLIFFE
jgi:hypothetical protein